MNPNGAVLSIGSVLRGAENSYRVTGFLPSGMRGETYKAVYLDKPGDLIIKMPKLVLDNRSYTIPEVYDRIHEIGKDITNEATAWTRLSRNEEIRTRIADYIDFGSHPYLYEERMLHIPYIVQEFIPGDSLEAWCKKHYSRDGSFQGIPNAKEWFRLAKELMYIVALIHRERVVHGDIYPSNIIMTPDPEGDRPMLIDFGQAWLLDRLLQTRGRDTKHYKYYAPERFLAEGSSWYAPADIYGMSGVLHYLATGEDPTDPVKPDAAKPGKYKRKRDLKSQLVQKLKTRNMELYLDNPAIPDIIMHGLAPAHDERAFNADRVCQLIDVFSSIRNPRNQTASTPEDTELLEQNLVKTVNAINHIADELDKKDDKVLSRLTARNIHDLQHQVVSAKDRLYFLPGGDRDELVNHFLISLSCLHEGDEIFAMTTPLFWYNQNFGADGRALTMLKMMPVMRNVSVRWLLMMERKDFLRDPNVKQILHAQRQAAEEIASLAKPKYIEVSLSTSTKLTYYVGYKLISTEERDGLVRRADTFIMLRQKVENQDEYTLIAPTYTFKGGKIASLRILRQPERAQEFMSQLGDNLPTSHGILDYADPDASNK